VTRLEIDDLEVRVRGRTLLEGFSLTLAEGDLVALVGPNGAGKTTVLRAAVGQVVPTRGSVKLDGREVRHLPPRQRAALVAWLPQLLAPAERYAVIDLVAAARYRFAESRARSVAGAKSALEQVGAAELAPRVVTELSGGERQRVAIAALLAQEAPLLLLDEPANHLDPAQQAETYELLGRLRGEGKGVLCVTHDINLLASVAGTIPARVGGLAAGHWRFELPSDAPELPTALSKLFGSPMRVLEDEYGRAIVPRPARAAGVRSAPQR
jgi:iron complex transport system ATP-binding protein